MGYKVKLNVFEGPFDLLVYLIESARMNIYDIKVSEITTQYINYIEQMQQMDVSVSSEFMVLAAELIELKSKMLLPRINPDDPNTIVEDPRTQLVERILEYKKYKNLSAYLSDRELAARNVYEKPQEDITVYTDNPEEFLALDMDKFVTAFNAFLRRKKKVEEIRNRYERIKREKITAERRMEFIESLFGPDYSKRVSFKETLESGDRYDVAVSFSSMLEMVRQKKLTAEQRSLFAEIYMEAARGLTDPEGLMRDLEEQIRLGAIRAEEERQEEERLAKEQAEEKEKKRAERYGRKLRSRVAECGIAIEPNEWEPNPAMDLIMESEEAAKIETVASGDAVKIEPVESADAARLERAESEDADRIQTMESEDAARLSAAESGIAIEEE